MTVSKKFGRAICPKCHHSYRVWSYMSSCPPKLPKHGPRSGPKCNGSGRLVSQMDVQW